MTNVLPQGIDPRGDPLRAGVFARQRRIPHGSAHRTLRVGCGHAVAAHVLLGHLAMKPELLIEFVGGAAPTQPIPKPAEEGSH